ncbi:unnamed protein product [Urochloa humidicola]
MEETISIKTEPPTLWAAGLCAIEEKWNHCENFISLAYCSRPSLISHSSSQKRRWPSDMEEQALRSCLDKWCLHFAFFLA